jgi:hypothetical protein
MVFDYNAASRKHCKDRYEWGKNCSELKQGRILVRCSLPDSARLTFSSCSSFLRRCGERSQEADESAHYESIGTSAGIPVHDRAEPFMDQSKHTESLDS